VPLLSAARRSIATHDRHGQQRATVTRAIRYFARTGDYAISLLDAADRRLRLPALAGVVGIDESIARSRASTGSWRVEKFLQNAVDTRRTYVL
jgi:hypothetical protein